MVLGSDVFLCRQQVGNRARNDVPDFGQLRLHRRINGLDRQAGVLHVLLPGKLRRREPGDRMLVVDLADFLVRGWLAAAVHVLDRGLVHRLVGCD